MFFFSSSAVYRGTSDRAGTRNQSHIVCVSVNESEFTCELCVAIFQINFVASAFGVSDEKSLINSLLISVIRWCALARPMSESCFMSFEFFAASYFSVSIVVKCKLMIWRQTIYHWSMSSHATLSVNLTRWLVPNTFLQFAQTEQGTRHTAHARAPAQVWPWYRITNKRPAHTGTSTSQSE